MLRTTEPSIILGLDPGIADTGVGVIKKDGHKLAPVFYTSIKTSAKLPLSDRLSLLNVELDKLIKKYRPQIISIEELFFCKNVRTALAVGQARGVLLLTARQNNLPVVEFTPLQVKQAVSSYGKAGKSQVQQMVKLILGLKELPKPDDAADALAIAICAANSI